jgi:hypothetical protein
MVDADDLLKVILVLVVIWIGLEIIGEILDILLGPLSSVIGLVVVVLIVLFLLDRI